MASALNAAPLKVVVSFSILQDITRELCQGCEDIDIHTIVPIMADPHTYQPTPGDVITIKNAHLIIKNGIQFEEWIDKMIEASSTQGKVVVAAKGAQMRNDISDPHLWHDPDNAVMYVKNIESALCELMPKAALIIHNNAKSYIKRIQELKEKLKAQFAKLAQMERTVITTHDAFWFFGKAFGVKFESPIGISTEAEPTATDVAKLIEYIRSHKLKAIFIENLAMPRLIEQIAKETNTSIQGTLYADSLSDSKGPAPTYIAMMEHNANLIYNALKE